MSGQLRRVLGCPLLDEPHYHVDGRCDERDAIYEKALNVVEKLRDADCLSGERPDGPEAAFKIILAALESSSPPEALKKGKAGG